LIAAASEPEVLRLSLCTMGTQLVRYHDKECMGVCGKLA
jgi:hypothetical protein